jgi:hypothetical protein
MGRKKHSKMHVHESYMFALMYSDSLVQTPLLRSGLDLAVAVDLDPPQSTGALGAGTLAATPPCMMPVLLVCPPLVVN